MTELTLFYIFSTLSVVSAIMVISARNPVHSVLFLILVFVNASALLLLIEAEFIAIIFIVVYVGAIAVLFLFVVMMLDIKITESSRDFYKYLPFGSIIGFVFFVEIFLVVSGELPAPATGYALDNQYVDWKSQIDPITNIEALGQILYTYYFIYFLIAGLILLSGYGWSNCSYYAIKSSSTTTSCLSTSSRNFENAVFLTTTPSVSR